MGAAIEMKGESKTLNYHIHKVRYVEYANPGKPVLFVFHGYGQRAARWEHIVKYFERFNVVIVDLPGHGETSCEEISLNDWCDAVAQLAGKGEKFCILAYSMGARVALATMKYLAPRTQKLILLAPSGIGNDKFYHFIVNTVVGRFMFKFFLRYPEFSMGLIRMGAWLSFVSKAQLAFLMERIDSAEKRELLYKRWMAARHLRISSAASAKAINKSRVKTYFFAGKHDPVVDLQEVVRYSSRISFSYYIELNTDHRVYGEEFIGEIAKYV